MDITNASTEAFIRFNEFHERFNTRVQVTLAGMLSFSELVSGSDGATLLKDWVQRSGMPWPPNPRTRQPAQYVDGVIANLGQMAVVEAIAAFDWFTLDYIATLAQFSPEARDSGPCNHAHTQIVCDHKSPVDYCVCCRACAGQYCDNHKLHERIESICSDLAITDATIDGLLPLFHYFRLARNCIVHASGRASKDFVAHSLSDKLADSISFWNSITKKPSPPLPTPEVGQNIPLTMVHAILISGICHRVAKALDGHAAAWLSLEGFVHMAAFYSLFSAQHEHRRNQHDHPDSAVNHFMHRYRIKNIDGTEIRRVARELGIWTDIVKRARAIYPKMKF